MGSLRQNIHVLRHNRPLVISLVAIMTGIQAVFIVPSMFEHDSYPDYYDTVLPFVFTCQVDEIPQRDGTITRNPLKWWLHCASWHATGWPSAFLLPFSMAIPPLVYLLGYYITNDRLIGLLSFAAFIYNPLYKDWISTGTYDQVWTFFLLLSLVVLYKSTGGSFLSWIVSAFGKSVSLIYFPLWLYTMWTQRKDYFMVALAGFVVVVAASTIIDAGLIDIVAGSKIGFYPERSEDAVFRNISLFWQVIPYLALFVVINRSFIPKDGPKNLKLVAVWLLGMFAMSPIIYMFTLQDTYPYRYMPLAAFMSIFIAMTLAQLGNWIVENRLAKSLKNP
jgi:hypothetical protein